MRVLIISDIHGNLEAIEAVLNHARGHYDRVWCLGDLVAIGPQPNECVDRLRSLDHLCVTGDRDWRVLNKSDRQPDGGDVLDQLPPKAREPYFWTRERLSASTRDYLDSLPAGLIAEEDFTLVHGSPREPIWEYLLDPEIARLNFPHLTTTYCFSGHTGLPVIFQEAESGDNLPEIVGPTVEIDQIRDSSITFHLAKKRLMINPGSVGGGVKLVSWQYSFYILLNTQTKTFEYRQIPLKANVFRRWSR